jgi:hypothetical protein
MSNITVHNGTVVPVLVADNVFHKVSKGAFRHKIIKKIISLPLFPSPAPAIGIPVLGSVSMEDYQLRAEMNFCRPLLVIPVPGKLMQKPVVLAFNLVYFALLQI